MFSTSQSRGGSAPRRSPVKSQGSDSQSFLVIGLGNPGSQYEGTRHNIGQMALDEVASRAVPVPVTLSRHKKTNTDSAQMSLSGPNGSSVSLILSRPRSYMNLSGGPTSALARFLLRTSLFFTMTSTLILGQFVLSGEVAKAAITGCGISPRPWGRKIIFGCD